MQDPACDASRGGVLVVPWNNLAGLRTLVVYLRVGDGLAVADPDGLAEGVTDLVGEGEGLAELEVGGAAGLAVTVAVADTSGSAAGEVAAVLGVADCSAAAMPSGRSSSVAAPEPVALPVCGV